MLYLTSTMQIYTVRLPASTALQLHVDKSVSWEQHTEPFVLPVHHLRAEIEAVVTS